jgi:chemotaxis-related protein WspD
VVVENDGDRWVFPADEVSGVFHFLPEEIQGIPTGLTEDEALVIKGRVSWQERPVSCMDEKVLFSTLKGRIS